MLLAIEIVFFIKETTNKIYRLPACCKNSLVFIYTATPPFQKCSLQFWTFGPDLLSREHISKI